MEAIPTEYNGISFKSRLEADIARCLDLLQISWKYENLSYLLPSGKHYWPDFYLPEINQYLEGKGKITKEVHSTLSEFCSQKQTDIILIGYDYASISTGNTEDCFGDNDIVYLGHCCNCGKYYFESQSGWFRCRSCRKRYDNSPIIYKFFKYGQIDEIHGIDDLKRIIKEYNLTENDRY